MLLGTDQNHEPDDLSQTSIRMIELRDAVFLEWEKRVRTAVEETSGLPKPLLIDTLPAFYDNVAQAVTKGYPRTNGLDGTTLAGEHGGERARLTRYDPQALVSEYQIFRWTVFDVLHQHNVMLTHEETLTINDSIDTGIREAVNAFSLIHLTLRQQFVAALTHDLRGPLAAINTALELILLGNDAAKMKTYAVKAMENLNRMDGMIHTLLNSMADQKGQRMQLNYQEFDIAEVVKEVQLQVSATHNAHFQIFGGSVNGWWDRDAMKRAIENLVGNAVKYGDTSRPIRISFAEAYDRLVLMVHNEGRPIPIEEQECIFQIFRRANAAQEGTQKGWGIGLPFVRGVAESHGGSIALDSANERGTTFTIDIPKDARPFQDAPVSPHQ